MPKRTKKDIYLEAIKSIGKWQRLKSISEALANSENAEEQAKALNIAQSYYRSTADNGEDNNRILNESELRNVVYSDLVRDRGLARQDFLSHLDDIVRGIPRETLEDRLYDILPEVKAGNTVHKKIAQKHMTYLTYSQMLGAYKNGELNNEEAVNALRAGAAEQKVEEEVKKLSEKGLDSDELDEVYASRIIRYQTTLGQEGIVEYGQKQADKLKKEFDDSFDKERKSKAEYARTNIGATVTKLVNSNKREADYKAMEYFYEKLS